MVWCRNSKIRRTFKNTLEMKIENVAGFAEVIMQYKSPHDLIEITHQKRWLYVRIACKLQPKTIVLVPPQPRKPTNRNSQWHCFPHPFFILSPPDKRNTAGLFLPSNAKLWPKFLPVSILLRRESIPLQCKSSSRRHSLNSDIVWTKIFHKQD